MGRPPPALFAALLTVLLAACGGRGSDGGRTVVVFKHPIRRTGGVLRRLLREFEGRHPGVRVVEEILPGSTDTQFLYYTVNLAAGARTPDVMALDVIWLPAFAAAGWLLDLTPHWPPADLADFFPGYLAADRWRGRLYALPWFLDGGVLYYRRDLLAAHGLSPPLTWADLVAAAVRVRAETGPHLAGHLWQGKQYEGLVCCALEVIRSWGGRLRDERGRWCLTSPAVVAAVTFLRDLLRRGLSPPAVLSAAEPESLAVFRSGGALFLRTWPYAWRLLTAPGSPVAGRVGVTALPARPGHSPAPTLGGWHLAVNRRSRRPRLALALVRHLLGPASLAAFARATAHLPPRRRLYRDPAFRRAAPELVRLGLLVAGARPRPVTPRYQEISAVLQIALSRILAGAADPRAELAAAQARLAEVDRAP